MAKSALGAALEIPQSALEAIKTADEKLLKLQSTAEATASGIKQSFSNMAASVNPFIDALDKVITKLGVIDVSARNAGSGLGVINSGLGNVGSGASQAVIELNNLVGSLSKINGAGAGNVMQAVNTFQRLQEAMRGNSGMNIAQLKDAITDIDTKLKDTENLLTKTEQDALVQRKALLSDELREQQKTYQERVIAFQQAIDKMNNAQAAFTSKQKKNEIANALQATSDQIEKLSAEYRNMKAPDFSETYDKIQRLKAQLESVRKEYRDTIEAIVTQDKLRSGEISSAPALKKGEYNAMKVKVGELGDKGRALQTEIDTLTKKIKDENAAWREQRQVLADNIQMLKNIKTYSSDSNSLENQRSRNVLAEMREYYKELEKTSAQAAKANMKAAEEEEKAAERRMKAWEKASRSTGAYGQQYHNQRQSMYEQVFSSQNTTAPMALANSQSAQTLREHVSAIKELQQARLNLDTTDKNYKQDLTAVNEAIKQHSKVLREAGVNTQKLGEQTSYLSGYLSRMAQRTAVAFSISTIQNFVEQVAEVRSQFEISERSLEAILQNKTKADEIFNKTVELAVKSPFRIKDLTDYVRQLSAYRIESDKLYDTTKRLADVSAGLGVDMGRLILAYGQVKAAAYLRGSEVRQFTEAGINMYGELQSYFKEVKGEAYTTAQIVDMISKRKVTFEDVEAIFQRMTDKGGTFYNMQEIQAETLQGKISNLKDSFDVMLNDIGKNNEGTFKTVISLSTKILNNWQLIATAGKTIVGILVLLQVQAMRTGVGLRKVFSSVAVTSATKNLSFLQLLKNGFKTAGDAALTFGKNVKTAIASNAWLIAITAIVQVLWSIGEAIYDYNKKVREAQEETVKTQGAIGAIAGSYNELANAADNANNKLAGKDLEKNIEDRRAQLQKLIDLAAKDGLTFKINVDTIKDDKLDKKFKEIKDKYQSFTDSIFVIERRYAQNDNWNTWFTDGLDDDAKDYKDAVTDLLSQSTQMEQAIAMINANYDKATKSSKKYFDEVRVGQKDGESNLDYFKRMYAAMAKINELSVSGNGNILPSWLKDTHKILVDMGDSFNAVIAKGRELERELDAVFGDEIKKYKNDPIAIQAIIDKEAAKRDWSQYERDLAYEKFGIKVYIDKNTMNNEVKWVDDYLTNFFAKKKYGINLVAKEVTDSKALEDFLEKGDEAAEAAKNWKELDKRLASVEKNQKKIKIGDSIRKLFKAGDTRLSGSEINVSTLRGITKEYQKAATETAKGLGVDPFEKDNEKADKARQKEQRDLLQERISLLKDMNSRYNELIKTESKEAALRDTRNYFKEAAQNVGWKASDILPDDTSVAKRIREIGSQYKEISKRGNAFRISADIKLNISKKEADKLKEDISRNIDDAFSQLQLYKKLKGEGLSDAVIKSMFGDITTSFKEVSSSIDDEFNKYIIKDYENKYGKDYSKWGNKVIQQYNSDLENTAEVLQKRFGDSDIYKQYLENQKKIDKQVKQDAIDQAQELIKNYKQQLTDQLQLDRWYIGERYKLQTNTNIAQDPELKKQLQENLDKQYKQKSDENTWKDFQNSDMYVRLFDNLDKASTRVLNSIAQKLQDMRSNLKDLDPTQLKTITEQIQKVNEVRNSRNPFKAFTSGLKEMVKTSKELKALGGTKKYVELNNQRSDTKEQLENWNKQTETLQKQYKEEVKINGAESGVAKNTKLRLTLSKGIRDQLKSQLKLTDEQIAKLGIVMSEEQSAKDKFAKSVTDITSTVSVMSNSFKELFAALGGSDSQLDNALSLVDNIGSAVGSYFSGNYAGVAAGALGAITDIVKMFSDESNIDEQIKQQEKAISQLQHAYEKLKQAIDDAYRTEDLYSNREQSIKNLERQKEAYLAMIEAESKRKDPDDSKIQKWEQKIDDLNTHIKELKDNITETLGGFGSEANYKSAAAAFADAWVSAFNEGNDALDALNDKFDEYIQNLITKQMTQRVVGRMLEPLLKEIDNAVSEGSEGGNNGLDLTSTELEKIKSLGTQTTETINNTLTNLAEVLNFKGKGSSTLSALQQGIQSVTESTAQALESLINSIRYFLATQQADVRIIRDTLLQRVGQTISTISQDSSNSPVFVELRLQTNILTDIRDTLSSCVKSGHSQGRNGIKVFMN